MGEKIFKPILFNKEGFFCASSWDPYRWLGTNLFLRKNQKDLIKLQKTQSYFSAESKYRSSKYSERFLVRSLPREDGIKKLDEFFGDCIESHGDDGARRSFFNFLSRAESLSLWDLVTWGEKNFCTLGDTTEKALLDMGEDIFFRSCVQGSLGVILGVMLGFYDKEFLRNYYHAPYMMNLLFRGNSDLRIRGKERPEISEKNELLKDKYINIFQNYFPEIESNHIFSIAERVSTCLKGQEDHQHFKGLLCSELLYVVLEKNTPIYIRHFNHLQWSNFRQDVVSKLFFNADLSYGGRLTA